MNTDKISKGTRLEERYVANNDANGERKYAISANVTDNNNGFVRCDSGSVATLEGAVIANFDADRSSYLSINVYGEGSTQRADVMAAVDEFINDLKAEA